MELNEIKKILYKEKPIAIFTHAVKDGLYYSVNLRHPTVRPQNEFVVFLVPLFEIGDGEFLREMPAQLLIRYIIQ
jgi:hypothetical protein